MKAGKKAFSLLFWLLGQQCSRGLLCQSVCRESCEGVLCSLHPISDCWELNMVPVGDQSGGQRGNTYMTEGTESCSTDTMA